MSAKRQADDALLNSGAKSHSGIVKQLAAGSEHVQGSLIGWEMFSSLRSWQKNQGRHQPPRRPDTELKRIQKPAARNPNPTLLLSLVPQMEKGFHIRCPLKDRARKLPGNRREPGQTPSTVTSRQIPQAHHDHQQAGETSALRSKRGELFKQNENCQRANPP